VILWAHSLFQLAPPTAEQADWRRAMAGALRQSAPHSCSRGGQLYRGR